MNESRKLAFGVDPTRSEPYSLRQARYEALAADISDWAGEMHAAGRQIEVLDIGTGDGPVIRYLRAKPNYGKVLLDGTDIRRSSSPELSNYRVFFLGDLEAGYESVPSESYDVVVCEQVLEHLHDLGPAIATIERVLRPGGRAILGVPIFLPPLHLARRHIVPRLDKALKRQKIRGHVQAFSLASFIKTVKSHSSLVPVTARGFRIISGGILRPLEYLRNWWLLNRRVGALIPAACIEVQVIFKKA